LNVPQGITWWSMYARISIPCCHVRFHFSFLSLMCKNLPWKLILTNAMLQNYKTQFSE
jgi:hypothetical protein